jgi:septum site-determining protein MinC
VTTVAADKPHKSIRLRGRSFIAFVLAPELPIVDWLAELDKWTRNSPGFFVGKPVVLDLAASTLSASGIVHLISELAARDVRIVGLEGADESQLGPALPPLLKGGRPAGKEETPDEECRNDAGAGPSARKEPSSLVIESPIRSGQSVIFPHGDVTVLGSVASGAEISAGGSVHVYGTLRGRVLAGSTGNARARVFCQKNEAELLAIDGFYRTAEDMDANLRSRPVHSWLEDGVLLIAPLD